MTTMINKIVGAWGNRGHFIERSALYPVSTTEVLVPEMPHQVCAFHVEIGPYRYLGGACSFISKPVEFEKLREVAKPFALYDWPQVARIPDWKR